MGGTKRQREIRALFKEADGRSVNSLLARHGRERLFVRPLLWDHRQPALLQCRFLPRKRPAPPLPPAPPVPEELWEPALPIEAIADVELLHTRVDTFAASSLLDGHYPGNDSGGFDGDAAMFYYGQRPLCHVGYADTIGPRVVFLTDRKIQAYRNKLIKRRFPGALQSHRIFSIAWRRFTPPESMPDPYIAAVLIALAQSQREWQKQLDEEGNEAKGEKEEIEANQDEPEQNDGMEAPQIKQLDPDTGGRESTKPVEKTFPVVVVVHGGEHVSVFAADVTDAFLAKLDEPGKPPPPGASMDIHQQRVKFRPHETFAGRFAGAVRDTRHWHGSSDQDTGESRPKREGKWDSSLLSIRQRASSVEGRGADTAEQGATDMKRKQSSDADWCKAYAKESQGRSKRKRRREENESA